jgi:hypothetical protein
LELSEENFEYVCGEIGKAAAKKAIVPSEKLTKNRKVEGRSRSNRRSNV